MFSTPPKAEALFVEPLEARIAPTNLVGLANNTSVSSDPRYVTYATAPSATNLGFVPGSTYGVANGPGGNVYALKMSGDGSVNSTGGLAGDELIIFNSATGFNFANPFLQAVNGNIIAFFQDKNGDGQVQSNELTGLALGKNASVNLDGNVNGDIVTSLAKDGSVSLANAGKAKAGIASLNIVGNVYGSILAGGNINNVNVSGTVETAVHAGSAVDGASIHFGDPSIVSGVLAAIPYKDGKVGASISTASFLSVPDVHAGDGGLGAVGGSITGLSLQSDTTGITITGGTGGAGTNVIKAGAGGDVATVLIKGVNDPTPNDTISIQGGTGGADPLLKGGAGGSVTGVATSFDSFDPTTGAQQASAVFLQDNIILHGGDGGTGLRGGKGGSVQNSILYGSIPDVSNADGSALPEIQVLGGTGGAAASATAGHGGAGGGVGLVTVENLDTAANAAASSILVEAGDGGAGANGGAVTSITLVGTNLTVVSGSGGDGLVNGGSAGSINTVAINNNTVLYANTVTLDGGTGGAGGTGTIGQGGIGGQGGNINAITANDTQLTSLIINDGTHGNGGIGYAGAGGDGGTITNLQINDQGPPAGFAGVPAATIRSGQGGQGFSHGGLGGEINTFQLLGADFSYAVAAGAGGDILAGGHGRAGDGGNLTTVGVANQSFNDTEAQTAAQAAGFTGSAAAGDGGTGPHGGNGGDLSTVDLRASSDVTLTSGTGGTATVRKAGAGGSITDSAGSSLQGSVSAVSGAAGAGGTKPAAGGAITAFIAAASGTPGTTGNISITSGSGVMGGVGGDIADCGTSLSELTQTANIGALTVTAGNGSSANGIAGIGGSINTFNGSIGQSGNTTLTAGNGGGGDGQTASGAGGSIDQVTLSGANSVSNGQVLVTFDAGDAGQATGAKRGAAGGSVTNITVSNLAPNSLVQHVTAGDGANAVRHGGAGGSVGDVHVGAIGDTYADIGFRSGVAYGAGISGAGGLFAGVGGTGAKTAGAAGNVTDITANAIASIAAGKGAQPALAGTVDAIFLEGTVATVADGTGAFTNFGTANLVGSIVDPTAAGASTYTTQDGLIAAANYTVNHNFFAEALLTLDANGNLELVDYQQPNPIPVITAA